MFVVFWFWSTVALVAANSALAIMHLRRRGGRPLLSLVAAILSLGTAAAIWWMQGSCVLPHPSVVPYRAGMTLCPGQSAEFEIHLDFGGRSQRDL